MRPSTVAYISHLPASMIKVTTSDRPSCWTFSPYIINTPIFGWTSTREFPTKTALSSCHFQSSAHKATWMLELLMNLQMWHWNKGELTRANAVLFHWIHLLNKLCVVQPWYISKAFGFMRKLLDCLCCPCSYLLLTKGFFGLQARESLHVFLCLKPWLLCIHLQPEIEIELIACADHATIKTMRAMVASIINKRNCDNNQVVRNCEELWEYCFLSCYDISVCLSCEENTADQLHVDYSDCRWM